MMLLYKAEIKPLAAFASPLQSDTFFGAFCWSYKYIYGENALKELLRESLFSRPQIIFSNAFPSGYLPLPMGSYDQDRMRYGSVEKSAAKKAYQDNKRYKKCSLVSREAFRDIQQGVRRGFSQYLAGEQTVQSESIHNMVGRGDGQVSRSDEGGSLFVSNEYFVERDKTFDVYILSELRQEIIQRVLLLMLELGIGANKSTGKGCFELSSFIEETEFPCVEDANGYVALSNFIPDSSDPTNGWYKTLVKYGKLDREYAAGQSPFKKPLLYIQAGAVFRAENIKPYYGKVLTDVSVINGVLVNACTIAVPIFIP